VNAFPDKPTSDPAATDDERREGMIVPQGTNAEMSGRSPEARSDGLDPAVSGSSPAPVLATPPVIVPSDPAWTGLDIIRLVVLTVVALLIGVGVILLFAHFWIYPHSSVGSLGRLPIIVVAGQAVAYLLVLACMYVLVTRERRRPDFLSAIHWNWPRNIAPYLFTGFVLSLALQLLSHLLPMPKALPIDTFFRTPAEAWVLTIFGISLAPLMEELFFRGFLYPVLVRGVGTPIAIFFTAFAFALLHGSQLMFAWGPVLVIFLVGMVLTMVRAHKDSVAASLLIHVAYNGTISALMFAATDGFRHLERLNQ
jgi:uncharacterized protein